MQAKNFDPELLRLHPNWGHGIPEPALGNSLSNPCHKIKLKETDKKNEGVSHNIRVRESRKTVIYTTIVREYASKAVPKPETIGLVSIAEFSAIRYSVSVETLESLK